jgi:hypothetical protein
MKDSKPITLSSIADKVGFVGDSISIGAIAEFIGYDKTPISMDELDKAADKFLK